jgi:hypothetical protein
VNRKTRQQIDEAIRASIARPAAPQPEPIRPDASTANADWPKFADVIRLYRLTDHEARAAYVMSGERGMTFAQVAEQIAAGRNHR